MQELILYGRVNFCGNQIFMDFIRFHSNKVSYAWCLRYICSARLLNIRISTCSAKKWLVLGLYTYPNTKQSEWSNCTVICLRRIRRYDGPLSLSSTLNSSLDQGQKQLSTYSCDSILYLIRPRYFIKYKRTTYLTRTKCEPDDLTLFQLCYKYIYLQCFK